MVSNECDLTSLLSVNEIYKRASGRWDSKTTDERLKTSLKYNHIFVKHKLEKSDWGNCFSELTKPQRNILLKGELIRTYDQMSNKDKSVLKKKLGLQTFSSKWFKLDSRSKKILLTSIIKDE